MGISAELLVRDKLITFDGFKAIYRFSSEDIEKPIRLGYEGIYIYV